MIAAQCVPYVLQESTTLNVVQSRIHGLDHWFRVWQNAKMLHLEEPDVDLEVVALYALFHDSMRLNDGDDERHGLHGYKLWERFCQMRHLGRHMSIYQRETLFEACLEHNKGYTTTDPTIAVCWDSDRLDLNRKGIWPDNQYLSTAAARRLTMTRLAR